MLCKVQYSTKSPHLQGLICTSVHPFSRLYESAGDLVIFWMRTYTDNSHLPSCGSVVPHLKATRFARGSMGRADRLYAVFSARSAEKTAYIKL